MISRLNLANELLRHEDIEGLLSMGAPNNEYESEAEMIVDRVGEAESNGLAHDHKRRRRGHHKRGLKGNVWPF
jgi:hypothetical protein